MQFIGRVVGDNVFDGLLGNGRSPGFVQIDDLSADIRHAVDRADAYDLGPRKNRTRGEEFPNPCPSWFSVTRGHFLPQDRVGSPSVANRGFSESLL